MILIDLMDSTYYKLFQRLLKISILPSWVILVIDSVITFVVSLISFMFYNLMGVQFYSTWSVFDRFLLIMLVYIVNFALFRTYASVLRFSGVKDAFRVFYAVSTALGTLFLLNFIYYLVNGNFIFVTYTLFFTAANIFIVLLGFRVLIKMVFRYFSADTKEIKNMAIIGVDSTTIAFAEGIVSNGTDYKLMFFIDKNKKLEGKKIIGIKVYTRLNKILVLLKYHKVTNIVLVKNYLDKEIEDALIEDCLKNNITIYYPKFEQGGNELFDINKSLKKYSLEELLFRDTITMDNHAIFQFLTNKTVLITGGAGSIGGEIVNQVASYYPKKVVVIDQAETPLNDLQLKTVKNHPKVDFYFELADVANFSEIEAIMQEHKPDIIYHAAAYKHVPVLEKSFMQAIKVNIFGTLNLIELAKKYATKSFVFVSTDKAVNPTNIMGASKRIAELVVTAKTKSETTTNNSLKVTITRFGNVLGSNGSVVHLFEEQIASGGPVTVTHPEINRFFMTIPEACKLVLEAGTMGKGGEVFVFDMGEPIKIKDLAEKMIRLSGKIPGKDIQIEFTGLRPGEKLYEELLADNAKTLPTYHKKILIAQDPQPCKEKVEDFILRIKNKQFTTKEEVVKFFKELVPEFIEED